MSDHVIRLVMGVALFFAGICTFFGVESIHFTLGAICIALIWVVLP